jgi:hypothetical protein
MSTYCTSSPSALVALTQDAAPSASATPEDRSQSFRPVEGGGDVASGEVLLVQAYAVMWLLAFGLILGSLRRQRKLDERVSRLQVELDKARDKAD